MHVPNVTLTHAVGNNVNIVIYYALYSLAVAVIV